MHMPLNVSNVDLAPSYEYSGVDISAGTIVNNAFVERNPGKFADKVIHFSDATRWSPEAKRQAVELLLRGDAGDRDIRKALVKILETIRDPEELRLVFPGGEQALRAFLSGSDEAAGANAALTAVAQGTATGRARATGDLTSRLSKAADGLETVLELLDDPTVPQSIKDALIAHYGSPVEIQKAIDTFRVWARDSKQIDRMTEYEEIEKHLMNAEDLLQRGQSVLDRAERAVNRQSGQAASAQTASDDDYHVPEYGKDESVDASSDPYGDLDAHTLLAKLRSGELKSEDIGLATQLKIQDELQQENRLFTTISNALNTKHEGLKTIIGNIHA
jgi:hypothetical protein